MNHVPTNQRFSGLEPRDVARPTAGFLLVGHSTTFRCPRCDTRRVFNETALTRPVFESKTGILEFCCEECSYRASVGVDVIERPSWSNNLRVALDYQLVENH